MDLLFCFMMWVSLGVFSGGGFFVVSFCFV